jgi:UDP-N-acetylenolpyruvoylglucosamine reductase
MIVESNVPLQPYNSFGIVARAQHLARMVRVKATDRAACRCAMARRAAFRARRRQQYRAHRRRASPLVLKVEIKGLRLVEDRPRLDRRGRCRRELARRGRMDLVRNGYPGLENLALIPGTVGGSPVQNIGAYGVELQDRFESLDAYDLETGRSFTLDAAQCAFGYRDSVFKHVRSGPNDFGLAGKALILRVRFRLPKPWKPVLGYSRPGKARWPPPASTSPERAPDLRLDLRHPPRQAARLRGDRQRRQLLQEPHGQPRAVRRHHRARPEGRALPDGHGTSSWPRAGSSTPAAGRASRSATPACTRSRRWCW